MSTLYSKPFRVYKDPTFRNGDRVQISKYDFFSKVLNRSLYEKFLKL